MMTVTENQNSYQLNSSGSIMVGGAVRVHVEPARLCQGTG